MEELLTPAVLAGLASAGSLGLERLIKYLKIRKYLPLLPRIFTLVDPILVRHMQDYSSSDIRFAIGLAANVVADGKLSEAEIKMMIDEVQQRWLPGKAVENSVYAPSIPVAQQLVDEIEMAVDRRHELSYSLPYPLLGPNSEIAEIGSQTEEILYNLHESRS